MQPTLPELRKQLLEELAAFFGSDRERIEHARRVLGFAEQLLGEIEADSRVVTAAAVLHDVGIRVAEEKYGSAAHHLQEQEGPAAAREILKRIGIHEEEIQEVCAIIGSHHTPGRIDTPAFRLVYDADGLVNIEKKLAGLNERQRRELIAKSFLTPEGRSLAERIYARPPG